MIPLKLCGMNYQLRTELDDETKSMLGASSVSRDILRINTITDHFSNFKIIRYFIIISVVIALIIVSLGARMRIDAVSQNVTENEFLPNIEEIMNTETVSGEGVFLVIIGLFFM